MAVYVIGDLHLSESTSKPMDVFGPAWNNHTKRITDNWSLTKSDTCIIAGDSSWGINMAEAEADLRLIDGLPGRKILLKGNHDYWWSTMNKLKKFKAENNLGSIDFLFNNSFFIDGIHICGTRGWIRESGAEEDIKVINREAGRLRLSIEACLKDYPGVIPTVFLHYPPIFANERCEPIMNILHDYGIRQVYYGHLHGSCAHRLAATGICEGIKLNLISADYTDFTPVRVSE